MAGAAFRPSALAGYEDWPGYAPHLHRAGSTTAQDLSDVLGIPAVVPDLGYTIHSETAHDDVITARLSWQLGFGPRTSAWFVRPAHDADTLFAGGFGPVPPGLQAKLYGGRAIATWLAQQGFAVLAHDAFMWGSRRFGLDPLPLRSATAVRGQQSLWREAGVEPSAAELYDSAAAAHEETVAKAATRSYVVTCMMTTFASLLPSYLDAHSWLLHSPGLAQLGDWPDLAARSSARALVQYALDDQLFPEQGMRDAHAHLSSALPELYTGTFWQESHVFSKAMQEEAAAFLTEALRLSAPNTSHAPDPARTAS